MSQNPYIPWQHWLHYFRHWNEALQWPLYAIIGWITLYVRRWRRRRDEEAAQGWPSVEGRIIGGKVKSGVIGKHPSLTEIPMNNLVHHTDFRQVYAVILDKWLGVESKSVLGQKYEAVDVLKA